MNTLKTLMIVTFMGFIFGSCGEECQTCLNCIVPSQDGEYCEDDFPNGDFEAAIATLELGGCTCN